MHIISESITNFSERNTQNFRKVAFKALLCSLTMILLYIGRFEPDRHQLILIFFASVSVERIDIWGFSGYHRCRIETWFSGNRRQWEEWGTCYKWKRIAFAVKAVLGSWVLSLPSTTETYFDTKWVTLTRPVTCFVFPLHSGFFSWDLVVWFAQVLHV